MRSGDGSLRSWHLSKDLKEVRGCPVAVRGKGIAGRKYQALEEERA